jgi:hypothetical protein
MQWWKAQGAKLKDHMAEYGALALAVWLTIFFSTWIGFYVAIQMGFDVESTSGSVGTVWVAYGATQLTKPIRIFATIAITPIVAGLKARFYDGQPSSE